MIRRGEKSEAVAGVQQRLCELGYTDARGRKLVVDGDYGRRTEQAITTWASKNGIARQPGRLHNGAIEKLMGTDVPQPIERGPAQYGAYLWQATKMTTEETVNLATLLGLSRVFPKVMNKRGKQMYAKTMVELVPALQAAGIEVIPWAFLDDVNGKEDAFKLAEIVRSLGCDGAIANMEREIVDGKTKAARAHDAREIDDVLTVLSDELNGFIGFSSFRQLNYFPFPRDVFEKHSERVTYMPQCYNLKTAKQSQKRVEKSAVSWLKLDGCRVRVTLGAFPPKASQSETFGSKPAGIVAGADAVRELARAEPLLDHGFDWWALEQVREGYVDDSYRRALLVANKAGA